MDLKIVFLVLFVAIVHLSMYDIVEAKKDQITVINNGCGKVCYEGDKKKGQQIKMSSHGCCCKKKKECKKKKCHDDHCCCKKKKEDHCGCGCEKKKKKKKKKGCCDCHDDW